MHVKNRLNSLSDMLMDPNLLGPISISPILSYVPPEISPRLHKLKKGQKVDEIKEKLEVSRMRKHRPHSFRILLFFCICDDIFLGRPTAAILELI